MTREFVLGERLTNEIIKRKKSYSRPTLLFNVNIVSLSRSVSIISSIQVIPKNRLSCIPTPDDLNNFHDVNEHGDHLSQDNCGGLVEY